ncbi:hypothetical protein ABBQ32_005687 [Trebouxia sp. C0010 RCD-2024]
MQIWTRGPSCTTVLCPRGYTLPSCFNVHTRFTTAKGKFQGRASLQLARRLRSFTSREHQAAKAEATPSEVVLPPLVDALDLMSQQRWLAAEIQLWLDEEWTKLDVHRELGLATAQAYGQARSQGTDEIGSLLLSISSQLLTFDFKETFVNAFDVSNKAAELLMQGMGHEVCCG